MTSLTRVLALFVGGLYATGVCVHAVHTARFGAIEFPLLRIQYVIAGAWALVPFVVGAFLMSLLVLIGFAKIKDEGGPRESVFKELSRRFWIVVGTLVYFAFAILLIALALSFVPIGFRLEGIGAGESAGLFLVGLFAFGMAQDVYGRFTDSKGTEDDQRGVKCVVSGGVSLLLFAVYLSLFTTILYPRIPQAAGGGAPTTVRLLLNAQGRASDVGGVLGLEGESSWTPSQQLLAETDDELVLEARNASTTLRVSKDVVSIIEVSSDSTE